MRASAGLGVGLLACVAGLFVASCRDEPGAPSASDSGEAGSDSSSAPPPDAEANGPSALCRADRDCPSTHRCCPSGLLGICSPLDRGACAAPDLTLALPPDFRPHVEYRFFPEGDCLLDKCVSGPGARRLLRFPIDVVNRGQAPVILALPDAPGARRVACDGSLFIDGFLRYELLDAAGARRAGGVGDAALACRIGILAESTSPFDCELLGLEASSYRTFGSDSDCQWVDITTLAPGEYTLRVSVNADFGLSEANLDNNVVERSVTIAAADPLAACDGDEREVEFGLGESIECGWHMVPGQSGVACEPGQTVQLACTSCDGAYVPRACPGLEPCSAAGSAPIFSTSWTPEVCSSEERCDGTGQCTAIEFTCPASGVFSLLGLPVNPVLPSGTGPVPAPTRVSCSQGELPGPIDPGTGAASASDGDRDRAGDAGAP